MIISINFLFCNSRFRLLFFIIYYLLLVNGSNCCFSMNSDEIMSEKDHLDEINLCEKTLKEVGEDLAIARDSLQKYYLAHGIETPVYFIVETGLETTISSEGLRQAQLSVRAECHAAEELSKDSLLSFGGPVLDSWITRQIQGLGTSFTIPREIELTVKPTIISRLPSIERTILVDEFKDSLTEKIPVIKKGTFSVKERDFLAISEKASFG